MISNITHPTPQRSISGPIDDDIDDVNDFNDVNNVNDDDTIISIC